MYVGYRGWKVATINGELTLESPSHSFKNTEGGRYFWTPNDNMARCKKCDDIPGEDCDCGLYALKQPEHTLGIFGPDVCGIVIMWGKVLDGNIGFRSAYARVETLFLPTVKKMSEEEMYMLSARYGVRFVLARPNLRAMLSRARVKRLIASGQLPVLEAQEQYRQTIAWKNKREYSPDVRYPYRNILE